MLYAPGMVDERPRQMPAHARDSNPDLVYAVGGFTAYARHPMGMMLRILGLCPVTFS